MATKKPQNRHIFKKTGEVIIRSTGEHIGNIVSRWGDGQQWWEPQLVDGTPCPRREFAFKDYAAQHLRHQVHGEPTADQVTSQKATVRELMVELLTPELAPDGTPDSVERLRKAVTSYAAYGAAETFIMGDQELRDVAAGIAASASTVKYVTQRLKSLEREAARTAGG